MSDLKNHHQRPEGRLIEEALKRAPKKSMRKLADEVGLSEGRVRQIINGYQSHGEGQVVSIVGPAETVARLARAAGIKPEELRRVGRDDAAREMDPLRPIGVTKSGDIWFVDRAKERAALREWLDSQQSDTTPPPTSALVLWRPADLLAAAGSQYQEELDLRNGFIDVLSRRMAELEAAQALSDPPDTTGESLAALETVEPIDRRYGHDEDA